MFRIFLLLVFVLFGSACSVKFPNLKEGKKLAEKGAFPSGTPAWLPSAAQSGQRAQRKGSGIIPTNFASNRATERSYSVTGDLKETRDKLDEEVERMQELRKDNAKSANNTVSGSVKDESPLDRVSRSCSAFETMVSDALTTTDVKQRIQKYEFLSIRCPNSADIWFWLGKDYKRVGQKIKAGRCFEKVLVLDRTNKEAYNLLIEVRK